MNCLSNAAFKVYVSLLFNKDCYKTEFSPEYLKSITGLCKDTIRKSLDQLIRCGYIEETSFNKLVFNEHRKAPKDKETSNNSKSKKVRMFKYADNIEHYYTFSQLVEEYGYDSAEIIWEDGIDV